MSWARNRLTQAHADVRGLNEKIDLGARSTGLGDAYERGTAYAVWYPRDRVPSNESLAADAELFASLLGVDNEHDLGRSPESKSPEVVLVEQATEAIARPTRTFRPGQGFGLSAQERKAVEARAMAVAKDLLTANGYEVEDVSAKRPFDYKASRGPVALCVEVKGSTARPGEILTANEVRHQREAFPNSALVVVSEIELDRKAQPPRATGGMSRWVHPWRIEDDALFPLSFSCKISRIEDAESN